MAKKMTPTQIAVAFGSLVLAAVLAVGYYAHNNYQQLNAAMIQIASTQMEITQSLKGVNAELSVLKREQEAMAAPERFRTAVIGAIESYAQQEQERISAQKLQKYAVAPQGLVDGKRIYGSPNAQFTLVEFSDLECPYCKRFHSTAKEVVDQSNGLVNWEWRHMPLDFHQPVAGIEAHAAECVGELAGNRAFWAYLDEIFAESRGNGQGTKNLAELATALGVDGNEFRACMQSGRHQAKVNEDQAMGAALYTYF